MHTPESIMEKRPGPAPRDGWQKRLPRLANMLLWLLFCMMSGTGLLIAYRLPPGSRGGHGLSALGWTRHEWGDLHFWISIAFLALIFIHMALHWRWFWQIASKRRAWPLLAGMGTGLALLIGLTSLPVKREKSAKSDRYKQEQSQGDGKGMRLRRGRE
jgi:hypothetical protein